MSTISDLQASVWGRRVPPQPRRSTRPFRVPDATFHQYNADVQRGDAAIWTMTEDFLREYPEVQVKIPREYGDRETSGAIEFRATITDADSPVSAVQGVQRVEVEDGKLTSLRDHEEQHVSTGIRA